MSTEVLPGTLRLSQTRFFRVQRRDQREAALHDIRDKLTVVLGFSDLLARRAGQRPPVEWLADRLKRISASAERIVEHLSELEALYVLDDADVAGAAAVIGIDAIDAPVAPSRPLTTVEPQGRAAD